MTTEMRRCIGSKTYGIEPHEAPVEDFPKQPSQKPDGLGRMCRPHWNTYTASLARDRKARLAAEGGEPAAAKPAARKPRPKAPMMAHIGQKPEAAAAPRKERAAKRQTAAVGTEVRPGVFKVGEGEYVYNDPLRQEGSEG